MSANVLKMIALIAMTIDHMGLLLFPGISWMRIIGRIAFPIFAFMIGEGCRYTHRRSRYLQQIAFLGIFMQVVLWIGTRSLYQSVFISFTMAILLIYAIDQAKKSGQWKDWLCVGLVGGAISFLCLGLPELLHKTDYQVDYSMIGVLLPVVSYFARGKGVRLVGYALGLIALSLFYGGIQWFCLLALPFLGMYNEQRGSARLKNLFYFYYPVHLGVLYAIKMFL